jgi:hypothetical protein
MTVGVGLVRLLPRLLWWWKSESMTGQKLIGCGTLHALRTACTHWAY